MTWCKTRCRFGLTILTTPWCHHRAHWPRPWKSSQFCCPRYPHPPPLLPPPTRSRIMVMWAVRRIKATSTRPCKRTSARICLSDLSDSSWLPFARFAAASLFLAAHDVTYSSRWRRFVGVSHCVSWCRWRIRTSRNQLQVVLFCDGVVNGLCANFGIFSLCVHFRQAFPNSILKRVFAHHTQQLRQVFELSLFAKVSDLWVYMCLCRLICNRRRLNFRVASRTLSCS